MLTLPEYYLAEYGGSPAEYRINLANGQRRGQAFFNALNRDDQEKLTGTFHDPFYHTDPAKIENAIEFLLFYKE